MNARSDNLLFRALQKIAQPPRVKYVHDALTGRVIGSRNMALVGDGWTQWPWISEIVGAAFDCGADEVGCIETDDGEKITARGEVVAFVETN